MERQGVSFSDDLYAEITAAKPEDMSMSEFIRELCRDGLAVRQTMIEDLDRSWPTETERRHELRQAMLDWSRRDSEDDLGTAE